MDNLKHRLGDVAITRVARPDHQLLSERAGRAVFRDEQTLGSALGKHFDDGSGPTTKTECSLATTSPASPGRASDSAAHQVDEPAEDALPVGAQAVVLVLIGNPRPQAPDRNGRLLRETTLHV